MGSYRKRPVVVEAIRFERGGDYDAVDWKAISNFFGSKSGDGAWSSGPNKIGIHTLEGTMTADLGDWIIRGVAGEFYPCKPEIFAATYEPLR